MRIPVNIQMTKTNTTINIPALIVRNLKLEKGQTVELEVKKNKIIVHIVKEALPLASGQIGQMIQDRGLTDTPLQKQKPFSLEVERAYFLQSARMRSDF